VEVTAFHPLGNEWLSPIAGPKDSSLWPYSAPHGGRSLAVTLLCGVRTFLPRIAAPATVWPASHTHCNGFGGLSLWH